jgi:hypothetical protein
VVLSDASSDATDLAEVLQRHPQATLAAANHGPGSLVATRSGHLLDVTITDPGIAATVVFERLLAGGDAGRLPGEVTITWGGRVLTGHLSSIGPAETSP